MKPIILFLSAICLALLGVLAIYDNPLWWGMTAFLVWVLAHTYVPKLRKWCDLLGLIGAIAAVVAAIYIENGFSWLIPDSGADWVYFVLITVCIAYPAYKGKVHMRKIGLPIEPGDESKSDKELEAEDKAEGVGKHRNLHRGK